MANLQKWEEKIKQKRMKTPFRDFVKEVASWCPMVLGKTNGMISRFPDTDRIKKVVNKDRFTEWRDGLAEFGKSYNPNESFIQNFQTLFQSVDLPNLIHYIQNENSDFADLTMNCKSVYLSFVVISWCENILYSFSIKDHSTNIVGSVMVFDTSENVYMSTGIIKWYNVFYSRFIDNSNNIWFSSNLVGCGECFGCNGLKNKSYCINNKEYEKEEYMKFKKELLSKKEKFSEWYNTTILIKWDNVASERVEWEYIIESSDIENGHFVYHIKNGRNIILGGTVNGNENIYDAFSIGSPNGNDYYGTFSTGWGDNLYLSCHIVGSSNIYYSYHLESCSFCLGCIGLKNKSYCILNKQYTKEEWYELADKIFASMDADGTLWAFFPGSMNPFYFNDTMAYLIDDTFTKEEVEKEGYMWRNEAIKVDIPEGAEVVETSDLGKYQGFDEEGNWNIQEEILKKVIRDEKGNFYKIVPMELEFLRKHSLPLPEIHWLERIKMGFRM